jgi:hypothetical protein
VKAGKGVLQYGTPNGSLLYTYPLGPAQGACSSFECYDDTLDTTGTTRDEERKNWCSYLCISKILKQYWSSSTVVATATVALK